MMVKLQFLISGFTDDSDVSHTILCHTGGSRSFTQVLSPSNLLAAILIPLTVTLKRTFAKLYEKKDNNSPKLQWSTGMVMNNYHSCISAVHVL